MKKLILLVLCLSGTAFADEQGLSRWSDTILTDTDLTASTPVTTSAIPVGNARTAGIGVRVQGLGATDTVTITTLALESIDDSVSNLASTDAVYHIPLSTGGTTVISASGSKVYPIEWPGGAESLKFTVEAGPSAGARVKIVGVSK